MGVAFESTYGEFARMYNFIIASGHGDKLIINPQLPMTNFAVWSACVAPTWLSPFLVLAPIYAGLGSLTIYIAYVARPLFAAAFDRLLPAQFAELSRYGTPKYGILFHLIATIIFLVPCYFGFVITGAVSFLITYAFTRWLNNLAAALLPYIKPHIYKTSIRRQPEVAGIPLITICGTVAFLVLLYMVFLFSSATPITSMFFVAATYTFALIWFTAYANRLRKMDIDVDKMFSVLPPA
jgi:amino acid transporter